MIKPIIINVGLKFGRLTIIEDLPLNKNKHKAVMAKCECGVVKEYELYAIQSGHTTSCGCRRKEVATKLSTSHGLISHKLYPIWKGMKYRCYNPNVTGYKYYGGSGVAVCKEWEKDFKAFYEWAIKNGWKPGLQIDKDIIPAKLGIPALLYSPELCCFVTSKKNSRTRRTSVFYEYKGEKKTLPEWAEIYKIKISTLKGRVYVLNWSIDIALTTIVK